ncbi:Uncharacterised protein [Dermatophilus congolensis]|uniref:Uncharacterized protein n=1 Tax=Dermatophilus congolensis TaxID=1863 RepID=A0AA46H0P4_9MICO|nr:Uncharacterised protein [Dermatophilus congolensis]
MVRMAVVAMMVMVAPVRVAVMVSQGPWVKSDPSSQRVKEVRGDADEAGDVEPDPLEPAGFAG